MVPAASTSSRVSSVGTWSAKLICARVAVDPVFSVGVAADSGSLMDTPSTASMAFTSDATSAALAWSVILPLRAENSTWPDAPVSPKRSASRSCPSCESVPGIEKESSYLSPSIAEPPPRPTRARTHSPTTSPRWRATILPRRYKKSDTSQPPHGCPADEAPAVSDPS